MEHQSSEVDKIFPALIKLQSEINNPAKDKQGHGYKYADLAQILNLSRDPLSENGLAITQYCSVIDGGSYLVTQMVHSSGQWIRGFYPLEKAGMRSVNDAQQMGAAMTYARRYNLAAMLGVAQEDDDAASLSREPRNQRQNQQPELIDEQQKLDLMALLEETESDINGFLRFARVNEISEIRADCYQALIKKVQEKKK
ncbi:putative recombination protein [Edwardsiella phage GF-2]|uniref:Putative recombination protein n=1 Tax=Edwardsiella phage GF-2 TaxID=1537091 RepID=A0A077KCB6_9CAUD|nr:Erf-like ssDNA annealing protein [Edwardsiella phage GF-2]ELM3660006.1 ERF family protein [Edwardsiella piscicida]BAP28919.1 putative recombination protein [Edwardsiella phage GF-2]